MAHDPYKDVKDAAEALTKARLEAAKPSAESNDLQIVPMVQATTPVDEQSKKANTGGVEVKGSPESPSALGSDGFTDGALADPALEAATKSSKK